MPILFIDTHSEKVTVAIIGENLIYKREKVSDRSHSEVVVPMLDEVLKDAGLKLEDIGEIIVVNGPGSFTGVRIGVTIAKTIAYSLSTPIKTVTSLEMFGVSSDEEFDVVIVTDAKGVYSARKTDKGYEDFIYQRKAEFEEYVQKSNYKVLNSKTIDFDKIIDYVSSKKAINPHTVNPIYIKEIDALR